MMFHRHKMHINRIERLSISVFLYTFAIALISPVYPIFIKSITGSDAMVGIIYGITSFLGLGFCILSGEVMHRYGRALVLRIASMTLIACFMILTLVHNTLDLFVVESMRVMAVTSVVVTLGVLVKTYSRKNDLEKSEGKFYTVSNMSWLIAPALSGFIFMKYEITTMFLLAALVIALAYVSLDRKKLVNRRLDGNVNFQYIRAHIINKSFMPSTYYFGVKTIMKEVRHFVRNKNLLGAYIASFGLYMLFSTMWIYLPIILHSFNTSGALIGIMTGALVLPLIMFEIPLTKLSKRINTKIFLTGGFLVAACGMSLVYFFYSKFMIFALFLFAGLGAAMIEPFKEAYFLKHCPSHKTDVFFGIFKTSQYLGYSLAPILNSIAILYLGLQGMFIVIGPIMLIFAIVARRLE